MEVRQEVHVVREVLEAALPAELATSLIFNALRDVPELPRNTAGVIAMCRGPLAKAMRDRCGEAVTYEVLKRISQVLVTGNRAGTEIPIEVEFDDEGDVEATMAMPIVWQAPVSVLVVSSKFRFAERLVASLGDDRVYVTAAMDEHELRKHVFASQPLLVVVDATAAPAASDEALALCLKGLPDRALGVVWGVNTDYGKTLIEMLRTTGDRSVGIDEHDGIEPLLDLVLARYGGGEDD